MSTPDDLETPNDPQEQELFRLLAAYREALLGRCPFPCVDHLGPAIRHRWDRLCALTFALDQVGRELPPPSTLASANGRTPFPRPAADDRTGAYVAESPGDEAPMAQVGRYRVLGALGRGGMGVVYEAWDPDLRRRVALKQIHPARAADPICRARFIAEAQLLARLGHPNVVRVHEVGEFEGMPFLVMEYVNGPGLREWLAGMPLEPRQAARLVADLASGVEHAHRAGVVHRDLKPSNVLLQRGGEDPTLAGYLLQTATTQGLFLPRISDFGLATLRDQESGLTQTGELVGTPGYMAPEMAAGVGGSSGAALDVYGLGTILYEVLTGHPPFVGVDPVLVLSQVRFLDPVSPRRLQPDIPRDLETICLHCLRKEPNRRYASAALLTADLERFLEGRPIQARPVGPLERSWRWCRRNPTVATLTAALAVLLLTLAVGGPVLAFQQARLAADLEQRNRDLIDAQQQQKANLDLAKKAVDDCFNVARDDPLFQQPRMEKARKRLLEKTLPFYKQFRGQSPDDRVLQREEAEQWFRVGYIVRVLGRTTEALKEYRQARDLQSKLVQAHPDELSYQEDLARTHNNLALLLAELGKRQEALKEFQQARDLQRKLVEAQPKLAEHQYNLARARHNLSVLLSEMGKREESIAEFKQARDLQRRLFEAHPEEPRYQSELALTHNNLAALLRERGKLQEALVEYQHARTLLSKLVKAHPDVPEYQKVLSGTHNNLGLLLKGLDQRQEALTELKLARDLWSALVKAHPDVPDYQDNLAQTHHNLGNLFTVLGERQEALAEFRLARDLQSTLHKAHPDTPRYRNFLAATHNSLAILLAEVGEAEEAMKEHQQARDLWRRLVTDQPEVLEYQKHLAGTHHNLGALLRQMGKREEAIKEFQQACDLRARLVKAYPRLPQYLKQLALTHTHLGNLLFELRQFQETLPEYEQARDLQRKLVKAYPDVPEYRIDLAGTCCNLGHLLRDSGKAQQSLDHFAQAIQELDTALRREPNHATARLFLRNSYLGRAEALTVLGRHRVSDADWDRAAVLTPRAQRAYFLLSRAESRARGGDYAQAAVEASLLGRGGSLPPPVLYRLACVHALSAASAGRDASRPLPERDKRSNLYAQQAVALLARAATAGYFRAPEQAMHLDKNSDLAFLRDRDDYKRFRSGLKLEL